MTHPVKSEKKQPQIDKASLLQTLAIKEEQEVNLLKQTQVQAEKLVQEAQSKSLQRHQRLETELVVLEKEILDREISLGKKEAETIREKAQKALEIKKQKWKKNLSNAVDQLVQRILKV